MVNMGSGNYLVDRMDKEMDMMYKDVSHRCPDCECFPCECDPEE